MELDSRIREMAQAWGADLVGVADLAPAQPAILAQGGPVVASFGRAVSIGVGIFHAIVDQLPNRADHAVAVSYRHHCYDVINLRLDLAASRLGSLLQAEGFRALPVPASKKTDAERLMGAFSHKMAAHLAGLGWIGKSCLLVTPQVGPRVRWATILTDAPLAPSGGPPAERCGECVQCVEICPVRAFSGRPFRQDEPRQARYDAHKCERYFAWLEQQGADPAVCGLCLYVCPYGRQQADRLHAAGPQ